jgi:hypothetical protein
MKRPGTRELLQPETAAVHGASSDGKELGDYVPPSGHIWPKRFLAGEFLDQRHSAGLIHSFDGRRNADDEVSRRRI